MPGSPTWAYWLELGNANLPIGFIQAANREIGVPGDCAEKNRTLESLKGAALEKFKSIQND